MGEVIDAQKPGTAILNSGLWKYNVAFLYAPECGILTQICKE